MSETPKLILRLGLAYLKHRIVDFVGKDFLGVLSSEMPDIDVNKAISISTGSKEYSEAIEDADNYFRKRCIEEGLPQELLQALTMPWGDLPSIRSAVSDLPDELDFDSLDRAIRKSLRDYNLPEQTIEIGVDLYLDALQKSFARLEEYTQTIIVKTLFDNRSALSRLETTNNNSLQLLRRMEEKINYSEEEDRSDFREILILLNKVISYVEQDSHGDTSVLSNFTCGNWSNYLNQVLNQTKTFTGLENDYQIPKTLDEKVELFLNDESTKIFVIEGTIGAGKTSYLEMISRKWGKANMTILDNEDSEKIIFPPQWIPMLISLRNRAVSNHTELSQILTSYLSRHGLQSESRLSDSAFDMKSIKWLLLLDGLDEQRENVSARIFDAVRDFSSLHESVKIIISTRPIIDFDKTDSRIYVNSDPVFGEQEIYNYLSIYFKSRDALMNTALERERPTPISVSLEQVVDVLRNDPDLWNLCSNPLFLSELKNILAEAVITAPALFSSALLPIRYRTLSRRKSVQKSINLRIRSNSASKRQLPVHIRKIFHSRQMRNRAILEFVLAKNDFIHKDSIYSQMYNNIIKREKYRRAANRGEFIGWHSKIGELALITDGGRSKKFTEEAALEIVGDPIKIYWMLNFGVIDYVEDMPGWLCFPNFSVKVHFARTYLQPFFKEGKSDAVMPHLEFAELEFRKALRDMTVDLNFGPMSKFFEEATYERQGQ